MPLQAMLNRTEFMNKLNIADMTMRCPPQAEYNRTGSGEQLVSDTGVRLWQGDIILGRMKRIEAGEIEVLVDLMAQTGRSFRLYDVRRPFPLTDPLGTGHNGFTPSIMTLYPSEPREIRIGGLPAFYTLTAGDYLSFYYGSNPVRYALHRVVSTVTAGSGGNTPVMEVDPPIRPGAAVGETVELRQPWCKAVLIAGSVQPNRTRHTISEGLRFSFVQSLR
jgi:hypothetical protein